MQCPATQECCEGELPTRSVLPAHNEGRPASPALPHPRQLQPARAADPAFWFFLADTGLQLLQQGHPKAAGSIQSNKPWEGVVKKTAKDVLYLSFFVWKSGQSSWRTHCWSWGQRGSSWGETGATTSSRGRRTAGDTISATKTSTITVSFFFGGQIPDLL